MTYAERIRSKLEAAFAPESLKVIDESADHAGHSGAHVSGETHFRVEMKASSLAGQSRLAQQRAVYAVLKEEMAERVHALALRL